MTKVIICMTKVIIFRAFDVTGHIIVREKDEIYKLAKVANFVSILPKSGINYISN